MFYSNYYKYSSMKTWFTEEHKICIESYIYTVIIIMVNSNFFANYEYEFVTSSYYKNKLQQQTFRQVKTI